MINMVSMSVIKKLTLILFPTLISLITHSQSITKDIDLQLIASSKCWFNTEKPEYIRSIPLPAVRIGLNIKKVIQSTIFTFRNSISSQPLGIDVRVKLTDEINMKQPELKGLDNGFRNFAAFYPQIYYKAGFGIGRILNYCQHKFEFILTINSNFYYQDGIDNYYKSSVFVNNSINNFSTINIYDFSKKRYELSSEISLSKRSVKFNKILYTFTYSQGFSKRINGSVEVNKSNLIKSMPPVSVTFFQRVSNFGFGICYTF